MTLGLIFHHYLFLLLQISNAKQTTKPKCLRLRSSSVESYLRVQMTRRLNIPHPQLMSSFLCIFLFCSSSLEFSCSNFLILSIFQSQGLVPLLYETSWVHPAGQACFSLWDSTCTFCLILWLCESMFYLLT